MSEIEPERSAAWRVVHATDEEAVAVLNSITDPISRAWAAEDAIAAATALRGRFAEVRRQALAEAHDAGKSWADLGREFGVSASRAQQIVQGRSDRRGEKS